MVNACQSRAALDCLPRQRLHALSSLQLTPPAFFNLHDGRDLPDNEGTELAGRNEAHRQAIITAGEMLREGDRQFLANAIWEMHVTDAQGATVCRLKFSA